MVHTYIQKTKKNNIIKIYEISSTLEYIIEIISTKIYNNKTVNTAMFASVTILHFSNMGRFLI